MKAKLYLLFFFVQLITAMEIEISITNQELTLRDDNGVIKTYKISTSKYGEGSTENSFKTPLGKHEIKKMIGKDVIIGGRFIGRVHTGEVFPIYSDQEIYVKEDVVQKFLEIFSFFISIVFPNLSKNFLTFLSLGQIIIGPFLIPINGIGITRVTFLFLVYFFNFSKLFVKFCNNIIKNISNL